jgi:hypothetical protein
MLWVVFVARMEEISTRFVGLLSTINVHPGFSPLWAKVSFLNVGNLKQRKCEDSSKHIFPENRK